MLTAVINGIDWFVEKEGKLSSFLIYPLVLIVLYEVLMRYVFNAPTTWGFEATAFLYGLHYMFGLSYTENQAGHVRVDILTSRLSERAQAVLGLIGYLLVFLPIYVLMAIGTVKYAQTATVMGELNSTSWAQPLGPLKILMAWCFLTLVVQGFSTLLKHLRALTGKS